MEDDPFFWHTAYFEKLILLVLGDAKTPPCSNVNIHAFFGHLKINTPTLPETNIAAEKMVSQKERSSNHHVSDVNSLFSTSGRVVKHLNHLK